METRRVTEHIYDKEEVLKALGLYFNEDIELNRVRFRTSYDGELIVEVSK
jgi:hypothetical protein